MIDWIKKQTISAWIIIGATVLALVSLIFYIATSTTGFLAGSAINPLPIVFTILAILGAAALIAFAGKMNKWAIDGAVVAITVLLIVSLMVFMNVRVPLVADVYFIPVNIPPEEISSLNVSIVGFVFYGLSVLAMIAASFFRKLTKAE